ncbi:MAG: hypothetical protein ABEJ80_09055 [Halarchaeum sp.]
MAEKPSVAGYAGTVVLVTLFAGVFALAFASAGGAAAAVAAVALLVVFAGTLVYATNALIVAWPNDVAEEGLPVE